MAINKTIIFCQAPADIPYVLSLYEQIRETSDISIFVINVEGMFRFLNDLKLDLEQLIFIPYQLKNLKKLLNLNSERRRINSLFRKYFADVEQAEVFFFSRFEDWLTAAFLHKLSRKKGVQIAYLNHYDHVSFFEKRHNMSLGLRAYVLTLKFLTGINFRVKIIEKLPELPIEDYNIIEKKPVLNEQVFAKYAYVGNFAGNGKSGALFFLSECEDTIYDCRYYNNTLVDIISILHENNYNVIAKGHPRTGMPVVVKKICDNEIPAYVPGEFIDTSNIRICLGLDTNAICYFAKTGQLATYSLIRMVPTADIAMTEILVNFLETQSENTMKFIDNKEQLYQVVQIHFNQQ